MLYAAFPSYLREDLDTVMEILPNKTFGYVSAIISDNAIPYILTNNIVEIPDRFYLLDIDDTVYDMLSQIQKQILCCIYTRSCNGYIREKYLRKLLDMSFEEWAIPFIVKLCDEYVLEILEVIYNKLKIRNNTDIQSFCFENRTSIFKSYSRMISYWNEYYREQHSNLNQYIGRRLFRECLGYDRSFDK